MPYEEISYEGALEQGKYAKVEDFYAAAKGGSGGVVKCKIFELGWRTKKEYVSGSDKVRVIGGEDFQFPDAIADVPINYTDNFIVNDWFSGFPRSGGFLRDRSFFYTKSGKLSISGLKKHNNFSLSLIHI